MHQERSWSSIFAGRVKLIAATERLKRETVQSRVSVMNGRHKSMASR